MHVLLAAKPESDQFTRAYRRALGCEVMITRSAEAVRQRAAHADVLWLEWANPFTMAVLEPGPLPCRVVVRVHDYEIRTRYVERVAWQHVDLVWLVNPEARWDFIARVPGQAAKTFVLPNAVDASQFKARLCHEKTIGMLSLGLQQRKRYDRALAVLAALDDPEWLLTIRTRKCDTRALLQQARALGVEDQLVLEWSGLPAGTSPAGLSDRMSDKRDVQRFFDRQRVVMSTSEHEAFHYAVAEGALCGCQPVVYDWEWGEAPRFWGSYVHTSVEAMAEAVRASQPGPAHRSFVAMRYSAKVLAPELLRVMREGPIEQDERETEAAA